MMNLSINLTLGSPGAESALNTAPAPEEGAVDSFSLKLADELSEQELTPPIKVEDTRAVDPALLEAIAARQKLAADSEAASAKDGRVWVDDPLKGLPIVAENEAEFTETVTEEKPWFDIIEKAKSYGPALQANKTSSDVNPETAPIADHTVMVGVDNTLTLPVSVEATASALIAAATATDATKVQPTADTGSAATDVIAADSNAVPQVGQTTSLTTEQALLSAEELTAAGLTTPDLTELNQAAAVTTSAVASTATDEKVRNENAVAPGGPQRSVTTEAATTQNKSTTKSEQPRTEQSSVVKASGKTAAVHEPVNESSDAEPGPVMSTGALTELPAEQAAKQAQAPQSSLPQQPAKVAAQQSAVALHENAEVAERTEPELPAAMMVQAQAAPANTNRATVAASGSLDKAPAANAFAEHLKTVNQTQQQQQQAGAEQQTGQGQAKATADVMLATQPAQPAATTLGFGQQLQQLQQAQPLTEHTAGATALTQPVTHSTGTVHTPLMSNRAAETTSWQAPLALTEPAAAQQLKDRVMVQIQHKLQTAEVQLHPEDMGSMQIKLNLQQDQLSVQFVVQQGAAKEALEQQMPKLRELLEQQGIALSEGQVEQRQSGGQQEQRQGRSGQSGGAEPDLAAMQTVQMKVSDRMVDFYA